MLHIFNKAAPIWEEKFHGKAYDFKIFKVAVGFSVKDVVDRVMMRKKGEEEKHGGCKGWGITEVVEVGDGRFVKVCFPFFCSPCLLLLLKRRMNSADLGGTGYHG